MKKGLRHPTDDLPVFHVPSFAIYGGKRQAVERALELLESKA